MLRGGVNRMLNVASRAKPYVKCGEEFMSDVKWVKALNQMLNMVGGKSVVSF